MAAKRYRVTGAQPVDGHKPGEEFSAAYAAAHERYLLTGGHLTLVTQQRPTKRSSRAAQSNSERE